MAQRTKGRAVPESLEWGFRPEIGLLDLPQATADIGELDRLANTLDGYHVWGDDRAVAAVSESVMQGLRTCAPCTSVVKLRTALLWYARMARCTDEVGPSLMPEEATYEPEMRALLMRLRECFASGFGGPQSLHSSRSGRGGRGPGRRSFRRE